MAEHLVIDGLAVNIDGSVVLSNLSHYFAAGTVTFLCGRSGSGKTMLLEMLSGLREPAAGSIQMGGQSLWQGASSRRKPAKHLLHRLGTAMQHPEQQLFAQTVAGEYRYSLRPYRLQPEERDRRIRESLAGTLGQPDEWLTREPFALSGGQQRRLSMALLEACGPEWLLLDEPTSGLDREAVRRFRSYLNERKAAGLGTIIATHDPEPLFDTADQVLLLHEGGILWSGTPPQLMEQPEVWHQAGLVLPDRWRTMQLLRQSGVDLAPHCAEASETAEAIKAYWAATANNPTLETTADSVRLAEPQSGFPHAFTGTANHVEGVPTPFANETRPILEIPGSLLARLDPRTIWIAYMLMTPGILLQTGWIGWLTSACLTAIVVWLSEVPFHRWSRPAIGLTTVTIVLSLFSGLTFGEYTPPTSGSEAGTVWRIANYVSFSLQPAGATFYYFSLLVMIMLIGFVLLSGIRPVLLKRALEQGLHGLNRLKVPVEPFAMTASLVVKFIPILLEEWHRFARIGAARGKYAVRPGRVPPGQIRAIVIPYMMALLRLGEALSVILIARGVGQAQHAPTRSFRLYFRQLDGYCIATAAAILSVLIVLHFYTT